MGISKYLDSADRETYLDHERLKIFLYSEVVTHKIINNDGRGEVLSAEYSTKARPKDLENLVRANNNFQPLLGFS